MTAAASKPPTSEQICDRFKPSAEARARIQPGVTPNDFAVKLVQDGLFTDAIGFVACCLGKREAVWWGCLCAWHAAAVRLECAEEAALRAAVRWVLEPTEASRKLAAEAGEKGGSTATVAGALALAAGWSDGSLSPPGLPVVAPPEFLTQNTTAGAVLAAAGQAQPGDLRGACEQFLRLARDVAAGKNRWEPRSEPAP
jgi:hypothetical protein